MCINKIIEDKIVEDICTNIKVSQKYFNDFVQEIYLILLEYDQDKLRTIYERNHIKFFLTRIIMNQWRSNTSPFYKKYRKYYDIMIDNKTTDDEKQDNTDD